MGNDPAYESLGRRIRDRRLELGLTLEDLAESCARHPTYIGQVERGFKKASLETLTLLAKALGLQLKDLFANERTKADSSLTNRLDALLSTRTSAEKELIIATVRHMANGLRKLRKANHA